MSNQNSYGTHQAAAEEAARQLIYSWTDDGRHAASDFPPERFPTPILRDIAEAVADASDRKIRGMSDILTEYFLDAPPETKRAFIECCEGFQPPSPNHCNPLVEKLAEFHRITRRRSIASRITAALEAGDDTGDLLNELAALKADADKPKHGTRERAYALRFNPDEIPPPDESCMVIGDVPIAARGNLTVIQGKSKVGKSAVVSAVLGAAQRGIYQAQGDTLCMSWLGESKGSILHLDTEQSRADWHALVTRSVTRSGMADVSPRLVSLPLVMFARSERLEILRQSLAFERENHSGVDLVVIDGIADLCASPNDEAEALELVSQIHALAQVFETAVFCILHENPSSEIGKTRGHLGSELNRKAFANLRIDKDAETSVSTIYGTDMRKRDIPREQGFCFGWDTEAGMHAFQGRAAGLKAAHREAEAIAKARAEWEPIFELVASQRENQAVPALTTKEAAEAEREISGKDNLTKPDTMKKRMQKAEALGVLKKADAMRWTLTKAGTTGNQRENGNHSRP